MIPGELKRELKRTRARLRDLDRELRHMRALLGRLARVLYTHTRTDLAPDAALPAMKKLVNEIKRKR